MEQFGRLFKVYVPCFVIHHMTLRGVTMPEYSSANEKPPEYYAQGGSLRSDTNAWQPYLPSCPFHERVRRMQRH